MANTSEALSRALRELRDERNQLDGKIQALERALELRGGAPKRRGRRTKAGDKPKAKRNWSPAARKAAAERMRKYWVAWRAIKASRA